MSPGNRWSIVLPAWLLCSSPASASSFKNGNQLLEECSSQVDLLFCLGYIDAVNDALDGNSVNGYEACVPNAVTAGQLKDIMVQYLRLNPADRHLIAVGLVADAISNKPPSKGRYGRRRG
jgi:Rap1a immunity proteins